MKGVIETRLTYHMKDAGVHCNYPLGLYNNIESFLSVEIERGREPIRLQWDFQPGWALLTNVQSIPMTKILQPKFVTPDYDRHEFWYFGMRYLLEIRLDYIDPKSVKS